MCKIGVRFLITLYFGIPTLRFLERLSLFSRSIAIVWAFLCYSPGFRVSALGFFSAPPPFFYHMSLFGDGDDDDDEGRRCGPSTGSRCVRVRVYIKCEFFSRFFLFAVVMHGVVGMKDKNIVYLIRPLDKYFGSDSSSFEMWCCSW